MAPRQGIGCEQAGVAALEDDGAAARPGKRPDVDHVVGGLDHVGVVFDDEHRVALVAQLLQQLVQAVHVARVHADARLVKDVQHVHQAAAQVLDHLDALRLAARERVGFPVQAEVFQPDVDHVLEPLDQGGHHRRGHGILDRPNYLDQLIHFHRRQIGDIVAVDPAAERGLAETGAFAKGTRSVGHIGRHRGLRALRIALHVARDVLAAELVDNAFKGQVDGLGQLHLDLVRLAVEQQVHLVRAVVGQLLVGIEQPRLDQDVPAPAVDGVVGVQDRALVERLRGVQKLVEVDADLAADAVALGAHALRVVKRKGIGIAHKGLPGAREEQAQHGVDIGDRAHGRVRAAAEVFLVDDDSHAQVFDGVGVRLGVAGQEIADEGAKGFVELAARFGGDRIEDDR